MTYSNITNHRSQFEVWHIVGKLELNYLSISFSVLSLLYLSSQCTAPPFSKFVFLSSTTAQHFKFSSEKHVIQFLDNQDPKHCKTLCQLQRQLKQIKQLLLKSWLQPKSPKILSHPFIASTAHLGIKKKILKLWLPWEQFNHYIKYN